MKKKILELESYLNLSYNEFCRLKKKTFKKEYYSKKEEGDYEILIDKNQFMFHDDILYTIEFNNIQKLKESLLIKNSLESTLKHLSDENIEWNIFSKYSYEHYLVIKINKYLYLEYEFISKWKLNLLRVSNLEE